MNHATPHHDRPPVELHRPFHDVAIMCAVTGITAIMLLVAAAWPSSAADEPSAAAEPPLADPPVNAPQGEPQADPGDGDLEIIESGYTPMEDLAGDTMVSWAAIVKNTSPTMTAVSSVHIEVYDADDESLTEDHDWDTAATIANLMPGQVVGVGSTSYIDDGDVDRVDVNFGETEWYEPGLSWLGEGNLTTSDVETEWVNIGKKSNYWSEDGISFPENETGDLLVTFTVESTYPMMLESVSACAVFRNEDGDIIGASRPSDIGYHVDYPSGWSIRSLETSYGPPDGIDADQTQVYALP